MLDQHSPWLWHRPIFSALTELGCSGFARVVQPLSLPQVSGISFQVLRELGFHWVCLYSRERSEQGFNLGAPAASWSRLETSGLDLRQEQLHAQIRALSRSTAQQPKCHRVSTALHKRKKEDTHFLCEIQSVSLC